MKISTLIILIFLLTPAYLLSQTNPNSIVDLETISNFKKGIYLNFEEFKTNSPSIIGEFEITNKNPNYLLYPEENNKYFIKYYNPLGGEVNTNLEGIWGFNDGFGIYIIHKNKPYKMVFFGSISILQYEKHYKKNVAAQIASLILFGSTITEKHRIKLLYFDPSNGVIFDYDETSFQKMISRDQNFLQNYLNDKSVKINMRRSVFHDRFNNKYPLSITTEGIKVEY